jgi:hypothetical protein
VDDILSRMGRVEATLADVRTDVASFKATIPQLATRADVAEMKASLVQWVVGTALACAGLAFAAARFLA